MAYSNIISIFFFVLEDNIAKLKELNIKLKEGLVQYIVIRCSQSNSI